MRAQTHSDALYAIRALRDNNKKLIRDTLLVVCIKFYEWREGAACIIHAMVLRVLISLAVLIMRDVQRTGARAKKRER